MRKNGCPMTVRDWVVDVLSRVSVRANPTWVRVKGITSLTFTRDGETEDGSSADSLWSEPYISKRSGSFTLEGKPAMADATAGTQDAGQAELDYYATLGGCDADTALRLTDPYGHQYIIDCVVTSTERGADDTEESVSWDMEIVGEPEEQVYVQVTGVAAKISGETATSTTVTIGTPTEVEVAFTPTGASNQKYSVASADTSKVRVANIDGLNFELIGVAPTASATTVDVVIRSMNNNKTATIAVTVQNAT